MSNPSSSTSLKPILAIDFEPVVYPGDAYQSFRHNEWPLEKPPRDGSFEYLNHLLELFEVHVVSWRSSHWEYLRWWKRFHWPCDGKTGRPDYIHVKNHVEPGTFLYIANRVIPYERIDPSPVELTKFMPYAHARGGKKKKV